MKKTISLLIIISHLGIFVSPALFSQEAPIPPATAPAIGFHSFPGIFTDYYVGEQRKNTSLVPLSDQIVDVSAFLKKYDDEKRVKGSWQPGALTGSAFPEPQKVFLAHSQGGVRALALAKSSSGRNQVGGVITLNSPVKGHSALDPDYGVMKQKLASALYTSLDGIRSAGWAVGILESLAIATGINRVEMGTLKSMVNGVDTVLAGTGNSTQFAEKLDQNSLIKTALDTLGIPNKEGKPNIAALYSYLPGIRDLAPSSDFMNDHVNPSDLKVATKGRMVRYEAYREKTASVQYTTHRVWWMEWTTPSGVDVRERPVYAYAYVKPNYSQGTAGAAEDKIPASTYVGFISGAN